MTPKMHPLARLQQMEYLYSDMKDTTHMKWLIRRVRQLTTTLEYYADKKSWMNHPYDDWEGLIQEDDLVGERKADGQYNERPGGRRARVALMEDPE